MDDRTLADAIVPLLQDRQDILSRFHQKTDGTDAIEWPIPFVHSWLVAGAMMEKVKDCMYEWSMLGQTEWRVDVTHPETFEVTVQSDKSLPRAINLACVGALTGAHHENSRS